MQKGKGNERVKKEKEKAQNRHFYCRNPAIADRTGMSVRLVQAAKAGSPAGYDRNRRYYK